MCMCVLIWASLPMDMAGWCSDVDTIAVTRSSREDFVCNFLTFPLELQHDTRLHQHLLTEISPNPPLYRVYRLAHPKIM
jgi:hypothetical protein